MFGFFKRKPRGEQPLLWLNDTEYITTSDAMSGILAIGGTGSGKTSTMDHLLYAMMGRGFGLLVLTAKGDDYERIARMAEEAGREADLIRVASGGPWAFDPIDYELRSPGGGIESAAGLMQEIVDFTSRTSSQRSNDPFFPLSSGRQMRMAIIPVWQAYGRCGGLDVHRYVTSLPALIEAGDGRQLSQATDPEWQKESFSFRTLQLALQKGENTDLELAAEFALSEWPKLGERTGGAIMAQTMVVLSRFLTSDVRDLICPAKSTCSPDDVLAGKIVVVDTPVLTHRESGQLVQLAWKLSMIRAVLRRKVDKNSIPICIWADEAQLHALPRVDSMFQAVSRSHLCANVAITQSDNLLVSVMRSREEAHSWTANMMCKLAFASSDYETMLRLSQLFGQSRQLMMSGTGGARKPYDPLGDWLGEPQGPSVSFSEAWQPIVRPEQFGTLRKGGETNQWWVDCYVTMGGHVFSNGRTFLPCSFKQRIRHAKKQ